MTRIIQRHDTAANWASVNPILAKGEMGVEDDTRKFKFGDGTTAWADLAYAGGETGGDVDAYTKAETDSLLAEKNNKIFDINKFTVVGSPTITDDGVATGFNGSFTNFIKTIGLPVISENNTFEIKSKIKLNGNGDILGAYNYRFNISVHNNYLYCYISSNGSSWDIANNILINKYLNYNKDYYIKFIFDGKKYELSISEDDKTYSDYLITSTQTKMYFPENSTIAISPNGNVGSIYLTQFSITVDGKEVFNGLMDSTKPIYDTIAVNKAALTEFKTDTSNNFSAVNSALNEKANLSDLSLKQNTLVSGTNIKTINGNSILGEGDLVISGGEGGASIDDSTTSTTTTWSSEKVNSEISTVKSDVQNLQSEVTTVQGEVVTIQGDVASLDADVSTLNGVVGDHTMSIAAINDSVAQLMNSSKYTGGTGIDVTNNEINLITQKSGGANYLSYGSTTVENNVYVNTNGNDVFIFTTLDAPKKFEAGSHVNVKFSLSDINQISGIATLYTSDYDSSKAISVNTMSGNQIDLYIPASLGYAQCSLSGLTLSAATEYYLEFGLDASSYPYMKLGSGYGLDDIGSATKSSSTTLPYEYTEFRIGKDYGNYSMHGSIWLEDTSVTFSDGTVVKPVEKEVIPAIATNDKLGLVKPDGTTIIISEDGTISTASGGGGTSKINDSGEVEAIAPANMVKLVKITQSEYDSLGTKDENTMYIATGDSTTSIYIGSIKIQ